MNEMVEKSLDYMKHSQVCEVRRECSNPNCLFDSGGMKRQRDGSLKCSCGWTQEEDKLEIRISAIRDKHPHIDFTGGES